MIILTAKRHAPLLAGLLAAAFLSGFSGCTQTPSGNTPSAGTDTGTAAEETTETTKPYDCELMSGHFTAGIDIPAGTYDIEAVEGAGNVTSSNLLDGGINAMMGVPDSSNPAADLYEQKYSNIKLPKGTVLSVDKVKVKLTSQNAAVDAMAPRTEDTANKVTLDNGNFTAGTDFPGGVYDIIAVSGSGNVSSSNLLDGGINAMMGTEDANSIIDAYEQKYQNISLPKDTTLTIDGVTVDLIPVK
jgi:hypothetical protein